MRLICPGCGAQYEVDDGVIPDAGRDVQCSACGHVWFQKSRPILLSEEKAVTLPEDDWEPDGAPDPGPVSAAALRAWAEDNRAENNREEIGPAPAAGAVPRRPLDDSLLAILREEAEREAQARRAESGALETQEEMILEPQRPEVLRPAARLQPAGAPASRGKTVALALPRVFSDAEPLVTAAPVIVAEAEDDGPAEAEVVSLPDIGEINSSLRASADRPGEPATLDTPQVLDRHRAGFRLGFGTVMAAAALATAAYGFAPQIGRALPALAPGLERYVLQVNAGRLWLDAHVSALIAEVQAVLGD